MRVQHIEQALRGVYGLRPRHHGELDLVAMRLQSGFNSEAVFGGLTSDTYFSIRWSIFVRSAGLVKRIDGKSSRLCI
jgi:hypothetical protein